MITEEQLIKIRIRHADLYEHIHALRPLLPKLSDLMEQLYKDIEDLLTEIDRLKDRGSWIDTC